MIAFAPGHEFAPKARKLVQFLRTYAARRAEGDQFTVTVSACRIGGDSELFEDAQSTKTHSTDGRLRGLGRSELGLLLGT